MITIIVNGFELATTAESVFWVVFAVSFGVYSLRWAWVAGGREPKDKP